MLSQPNTYVLLIYLLVAILYAWLGFYAWNFKSSKAVTPFALAMLGCSIWTFFYGMEIFFPSLSMKLHMADIKYIGIVGIPVFIFFFVIEFTGRRHLLPPRAKPIFWIIPALTLTFMLLNPSLRLMYTMETVVDIGGLSLLQLQRGVFFWVHILYSYSLLLLSGMLLIMELVRRPGLHRLQMGVMVLSILFPLFANLLFVGRAGPIRNLDLSPLVLLPTALGIFWAIRKFHMLEVMPLEHLTVLKNMRNGVIVLNSQQRVLYLNPVAENIFQRSEKESVGRSFAGVFTKFADKLSSYFTGGEHRAEIKIGEGKQARVFEVNVSPISLRENQKQHGQSDIMIVLHDITQRKDVEEMLSRREAIMSAISMAAGQFLRESTWEHTIPGVLEKIGEAAGVSRVYVAMNYTGENGVVYSSMCYEWVSADTKPQIDNPAFRHAPLRQSGFGRWQDHLSQGHPIYGLVAAMPESEQKFLKKLGCISTAVMPIFVDNLWWGFIAFDDCREERMWTGTELEAIRTAASLFGAAETRARTEQKVLRRQKSLNLMHEIVRDALRADNLKEMAQNAADRLADLIRADGCFLTSWDEENKKTSSLAASGKYRDIYPSIQPKPGGKTLTESVLTLGHTLIIEDAYNSPYIDREIAERFSSRSEIVLPLIAGKTKLGALIISFDTIRQFPPEEVALCEQAASLIALAYEKFKTMDDARRRADTSEILRKASLAIAEKLEMEQTVSHILDHLNEVIPYDSASVQLLIDGELEIVGGSGFADLKDVIGLRFPIPGDNPNTVVMQTGQPYIIPEIDEKYHVFNDISSIHIRSWLGVPLIYKDRTIGLLAIDSTEPNHFKDKDVQITTEFANQVAVALENARIFEETQSQAITDPLTGVYNRRGLYQLGEFEFQRARRIHRPFCAIIFDIDHFKRVNDHYGHATGDQILSQLVERCQKNAHMIDLIVRYGGEEFVILLPETNLESAKRFAERFRLAVMKDPFETNVGPLRVTISIGVAEMNEHDTLQTLVERADSALYKAKGAGRNCVASDDS